jgi:hypothetical protein
MMNAVAIALSSNPANYGFKATGIHPKKIPDRAISKHPNIFFSVHLNPKFFAIA